MNYEAVVKEIAKRESVTVAEIENEMKKAIEIAGLKCSPKEFIEITSAMVKNRTIYSI